MSETYPPVPADMLADGYKAVAPAEQPPATTDPADTLSQALERASSALSQATTDFERITLRDTAQAAQAAAAVLKRRDIESRASVLVARAERAIAKANPPRPRGRPAKGEEKYDSGVAFSEPPVPERQMQRIRSAHRGLTDAQFDDVLRQAQASQEAVSRKTLRKLSRDAQRNERREAHRSTLTPQALPRLKYGLILADPPYRYEQAPSQERRVEQHYPTLSDREICDLAVPSLCAESAVLLLWATNPRLPTALKVMQAWGFTYKTNLAWVKPQVGMGFWLRGRHELLLLGVRGNFPAPEMGTQPESVLEAPRGRHSEKPEAVYELAESLFPGMARIELFARETRTGWHTWGNEPTGRTADG